MSDITSNMSLDLHRNHLNTFVLWDDVYLANEANAQGQSAFFYSSIAKVAWFTFLFFTAVIFLVHGTLNAYTFLASLYPISHVYQPFMEATYHVWNDAAAKSRSKKAVFTGILNEYQKLLKDTDKSLRDQVETLTGEPPQKSGELYLPLLAQYTFFEKQKREKEEKLQVLAAQIFHDESQKDLESTLHLKRKAYYHLEEQLCIQKIELAFLLHVLNHPFDKRRLLAHGCFNQKAFIYFCSEQFFHRKSSPIFFTSVENGNITWDEARNLTPTELHARIFKTSGKRLEEER